MSQPVPDLGGFHMVVSIRQREIDAQFIRLHRRLDRGIKLIEVRRGEQTIRAGLEPHGIELLADPGQTRQRARVRVNIRLQQFIGHDHCYADQPWTLGYRVELRRDELDEQDWTPDSVQLGEQAKQRVRELRGWEQLEIKKIYIAFTSGRMREQFELDASTLPADMTPRDRELLLELMDEYYDATRLFAQQNIIALTPVVPGDYHYDDPSHIFWPSSVHHSLTHNSERPGDSTLNLMAMALHQPPPSTVALAADEDPHGKIFYLPRFEGHAANAGGLLRFSQEQFLIHGFIDSLNYMARLRSGQHQRNWPYQPAPHGRWGATFTTIERGKFMEGDSYELRTLNAYGFRVENYEDHQYGRCVRVTIDATVTRVAAAMGFSAWTRMTPELVLYLTVDDGHKFYFHDHPEKSRTNHAHPQLLDPGRYERFRASSDSRLCADGEPFYTKTGPHLRLRGAAQTIFDAAHWRNLATPVFMPDADIVALRDPQLMYFRGFNNLYTYVNYIR